MRDVAEPTGGAPRARGRVLKAVAKTWPGFASGAVEGRAHELIDQDRYAEAAEVLEKGAERFGAESVSPLLLAWCLHMADRQADALQWAEAAVAGEPGNADAHWLRANVLLELDRHEDAEAALRAVIERAPEDGRYYMQLAWIGYEHREYVKTRELVEQAVALAPDDAWVQAAAGRIYDHHLRHRLAHRHYLAALAIDPENVGVRCDLAELLQTRGRLSAGALAARETVRRVEGTEGAAEAAAVYDAVLRRWPCRWYEWALRAALVLNVADWIFPTSTGVAWALIGALVGVYGAAWARSLLVLPPECRRDLVAAGRGGHFAGALARTAFVLAGISLVLLGELSALQHLGILALILGGYVEWHRRAAAATRAGGPPLIRH